MALWSLAIDGVVFASADPAVLQGWTLYTGSFVGTGSDTLTITILNAAHPRIHDLKQELRHVAQGAYSRALARRNIEWSFI
jgi:hypothetical protein